MYNYRTKKEIDVEEVRQKKFDDRSILSMNDCF